MSYLNDAEMDHVCDHCHETLRKHSWGGLYCPLGDTFDYAAGFAPKTHNVALMLVDRPGTSRWCDEYFTDNAPIAAAKESPSPGD